jgi:hypothetical protein
LSGTITVTVIGECVAELVRKLKTVLRPTSIPSCQTDRNAAPPVSLKVGLRMISPVIDVDPAKLRSGTIPPNLSGCRNQDGRNFSGCGISKTLTLHLDIERPRIFLRRQYTIQ